MQDALPIKLLTGHWARPTLPVLGWWLIESEPGSGVFLFAHDDQAQAIMARHNALWKRREGRE